MQKVEPDKNLRLILNVLIARVRALESELDEIYSNIQFIEKLEPKLKIKFPKLCKTNK